MLGLLLAGLALVGLGWGGVAIDAAAICGLVLIDRRAGPVIERWRRGAQGEETVGVVLDGMRAHGWHVLHNIATGRGNVDRILIGPAGVFTIETKSHGGRIHAQTLDERMLKQAYAEAKFVEQILGRKVQPLLVFSRRVPDPGDLESQRRHDPPRPNAVESRRRGSCHAALPNSEWRHGEEDVWHVPDIRVHSA